MILPFTDESLRLPKAHLKSIEGPSTVTGTPFRGRKALWGTFLVAVPYFFQGGAVIVKRGFGHARWHGREAGSDRRLFQQPAGWEGMTLSLERTTFRVERPPGPPVQEPPAPGGPPLSSPGIPRGPLIRFLLPGVATSLVLTAVFVVLFRSVMTAAGIARIDHPALAAGLDIRSPALDALVTGFAFFGGSVGMPLVVLTTAAVVAAKLRCRTPIILIVNAWAGSLLITIAGKRLAPRARPGLSDAVPPFDLSASFPSGHALTSVVLAGTVAYLFARRAASMWRRVLVSFNAAVAALAMGLSGVYLGHHWLTDVLAGWSLGGAWLAMVITAHRLYLARQGERP